MVQYILVKITWARATSKAMLPEAIQENANHLVGNVRVNNKLLVCLQSMLTQFCLQIRHTGSFLPPHSHLC
ncbi:hypothetical protein PROFUN_00028 [Planoprotostelium fungivorum]|uniref:Uncharacterized protein n=1 Tax=Planoprotostelium fungivorum TaxID=1890364 RepID=A0A2P6P0F0_9EUKA|nr:hypothetical protein PROFUN_00028 [Planoprotostelium fungivorum]